MPFGGAIQGASTTTGGGGGASAPVLTQVTSDSMLSALVDTGGYTSAFGIVSSDLLRITYSATEQTNGIDGWNEAVPYRDIAITDIASGWEFDGWELIIEVELAAFTSAAQFVGLGVALINSEATPAGAGGFILDHQVTPAMRYGETAATSLAVRGSIDVDRVRFKFAQTEQSVNCTINVRDQSTGIWERLDEYFEQGSLVADKTPANWKVRIFSVRNGGTGSLSGRTDDYRVYHCAYQVPTWT